MCKTYIRMAQYEDIDDILKVTKEAFSEYSKIIGSSNLDALSESPDDVKSDIENKLVFAAVSDSGLIGCARVKTDGDNAYLSRFAVKSGFRSLGVGRQIIAYIDDYIKKTGVKHISLHTGFDAQRLVRFYCDMGFRIESVESSRGYRRALLIKDYDK